MTQEVSLQRTTLVQEAERAADDIAAKRKESLKADAQHLHDQIDVTCRKQVFSIARKALKDLAGTSLESCLGEVFAHQLTLLDDASKWEISQAVKSSTAASKIKTAFELPQDSQSAIQNALNETFSTNVAVTYETSPELIGGIEFSTGGQHLAWSIDDYLNSMESEVEDLFKQRAPESAPSEAA
jgi:F-type H+-transporting ATPase subunit b